MKEQWTADAVELELGRPVEPVWVAVPVAMLGAWMTLGLVGLAPMVAAADATLRTALAASVACVATGLMVVSLAAAALSLVAKGNVLQRALRVRVSADQLCVQERAFAYDEIDVVDAVGARLRLTLRNGEVWRSPPFDPLASDRLRSLVRAPLRTREAQDAAKLQQADMRARLAQLRVAAAAANDLEARQ